MESSRPRQDDSGCITVLCNCLTGRRLTGSSPIIPPPRYANPVYHYPQHHPLPKKENHAQIYIPLFRRARHPERLQLPMLTGLAVLAAVVLSIHYLDTGIAGKVQHLFHYRAYARLVSNIPDLLLLLVIAVTAYALCRYLLRMRNGVHDAGTFYFHLLACTAPAAFIAKTVLKFIFGRVNTREWLARPELYGFHWFQGLNGGLSGFPSGHMFVLSALAAAVWRYYPRYRAMLATGLLLMAAALVMTNYHFLSDVIAGAYLGILVEMSVCRLLISRGNSKGLRQVDLAESGGKGGG